MGEESILSFARPKWRLSKTAAEKLQLCARAIARRAPLIGRAGRPHVMHEDARLLLVLRARAARGAGEEPQEAA